MIRKYYSSRNSPKQLDPNGLYKKMVWIYLLLRDKGYLKGEAGITATELPDAIRYKAALALDFDPFPIPEWPETDITEDHIFDVLEFLYDHVSKPGE